VYRSKTRRICTLFRKRGFTIPKSNVPLPDFRIYEALKEWCGLCSGNTSRDFFLEGYPVGYAE
jgi:hypothetical protein